MASPSKYRNVRTLYRGEWYDSKLEASRAAELDLLLAARRITSWSRGKDWELAPAIKDARGKTLDRAITYRPDFVVVGSDGTMWCEDTKGVATAVWKIKRRLWWRVYPTVTLMVVTKDGVQP